MLCSLQALQGALQAAKAAAGQLAPKCLPGVESTSDNGPTPPAGGVFCKCCRPMLSAQFVQCSSQFVRLRSLQTERLQAIAKHVVPIHPSLQHRPPQHCSSSCVFSLHRLPPPACTPGSFGAWPRCADAPPGYAAPNYGMSTPNRCPAGRFTVLPGQTVCDQ